MSLSFPDNLPIGTDHPPVLGGLAERIQPSPDGPVRGSSFPDEMDPDPPVALLIGLPGLPAVKVHFQGGLTADGKLNQPLDQGQLIVRIPELDAGRVWDQIMTVNQVRHQSGMVSNAGLLAKHFLPARRSQVCYDGEKLL
jgi:hypothetical protein